MTPRCLKGAKRRRNPRKEGTWERLLYYQDERKLRAQRKLLACIPEAARIVKLRARRDAQVFQIIAPSVYPPEHRADASDAFQVTRFDRFGPSGHFTAPDIRTAILTLAGESFRGPSWGSPGEYVFDSAR